MKCEIGLKYQNFYRESTDVRSLKYVLIRKMFGKISKIDSVQAPVYLSKNRVIIFREKQIISKFEDYLVIKDAGTPQWLSVQDIKENRLIHI